MGFRRSTSKSVKKLLKKLLTFITIMYIIMKLSGKNSNIRVWRSLVARLTGGQEAAGSSPVTRTISSVHNVFELWTLDFFVISSFFVMYGAGF